MFKSLALGFGQCVRFGNDRHDVDFVVHSLHELNVQGFQPGKTYTVNATASRGVTIRVLHDTIRISIQRSRYNTYLNTYLNTVRCQRDVMSSMKAETPVIRSPAHNLLLQWMEYLLLKLPMLSQDVTLLSYIRVFPSIWSEKNYVFQLVSFKNTCVYSFLWITKHWVCRIDTNRSDKISMHRDAPVNGYTLNCIKLLDEEWKPCEWQAFSWTLIRSGDYV